MSESTDSDAPNREPLSSPPWRGAPKGAASGVEHAHANVPDSFEQFLLEEGERKVEMKLDTRQSWVQFQPP